MKCDCCNHVSLITEGTLQRWLGVPAFILNLVVLVSNSIAIIVSPNEIKWSHECTTETIFYFVKIFFAIFFLLVLPCFILTRERLELILCSAVALGIGVLSLLIVHIVILTLVLVPDTLAYQCQFVPYNISSSPFAQSSPWLASIGSPETLYQGTKYHSITALILLPPVLMFMIYVFGELIYTEICGGGTGGSQRRMSCRYCCAACCRLMRIGICCTSPATSHETEDQACCDELCCCRTRSASALEDSELDGLSYSSIAIFPDSAMSTRWVQVSDSATPAEQILTQKLINESRNDSTSTASSADRSILNAISSPQSPSSRFLSSPSINSTNALLPAQSAVGSPHSFSHSYSSSFTRKQLGKPSGFSMGVHAALMFEEQQDALPIQPRYFPPG